MSNVTHPALDDPNAFVFYRYAPSKTAAIIFAIAFVCTTLFHVYQMIAKRAWYFTPFIVGGCRKSFPHFTSLHFTFLKLTWQQSNSWDISGAPNLLKTKGP